MLDMTEIDADTRVLFRLDDVSAVWVRADVLGEIVAEAVKQSDYALA